MVVGISSIYRSAPLSKELLRTCGYKYMYTDQDLIINQPQLFYGAMIVSSLFFLFKCIIFTKTLLSINVHFDIDLNKR